MTGRAGMQSAALGLLGIRGDGMFEFDSSQSDRQRQIMTPQREYPIFTPGFQELGSNSDSFQDSSDGQRIWKEIHTDTGGANTAGESSILTSSSTSLEQVASSYREPPAVLMSPSSGGGRIAMNTTGSNFYVASTPGRNYNRVMRGSPTMVPHSPQNVNILSPQLRPLEKSPKLSQLRIANPRVTVNGGLTPMVNQLTLSPEPTTFDHDPNVELHPTVLPPAAAATAARSPRQMALSSPVGTPMSSSVKLMKMAKPAGADQTPRPSVSKDRSPGRTWKNSFRGAVSPAMAATTLQSNNGAGGMRRDLNSSFQGSNTAARATAAVNSSAAPGWRGDGDGGGVAPALDRELCQVEFPDELDRSGVPHRVGGKKVTSTPKSGSYNIFNFRSWGKKKTGDRGSTPTIVQSKLATPHESFLESDDLGSMKVDSDSIKVLDYTIKTLRYTLEHANQKCAAAVDEVCALQSALEASDHKCRQLTQRCHELELKVSARSSGLWDIQELEADLCISSSSSNNNNNDNDNNVNATYIVGRREGPNPSAAPIAPRTFPPSQELTPEQFLKVFEDAIATLRKLASAICIHIRENGESATQVITALLEQHKVGRAVARMPRNVIILYFESFLNQVMFESFENVSFEPNGASSVICPDTLKQQSYQAFQSLRGQEWSSIEKALGKAGALVVNANFHRFFVVRMELILSQLGKLAESELSLTLMAAFFNAVKAVWLVHHMAFAFDHPVSIFRVSPASDFDARFMEQVTAFEEDHQVGACSKISIMLNPGFIVNRQIIKCQVYCSNT